MPGCSRYRTHVQSGSPSGATGRRGCQNAAMPKVRNFETADRLAATTAGRVRREEPEEVVCAAGQDPACRPACLLLIQAGPIWDGGRLQKWQPEFGKQRRRAMEPSMFYTALDTVVTRYIKRHGQPGPAAASRGADEVAVLEEANAGAMEGAGNDKEQANCDADISLWQEEAFFTTNPTIFWARPAGMRGLTTAKFLGHRGSVQPCWSAARWETRRRG